MKTLVVEKDGSLTFHEVNMPRFDRRQALVKMIACGMCGTDVKFIHKAFKGFPPSVYPLMLGHEGVGEVIEVGSEVTSFKKGDKVILPFVDADEENIPGLSSGYGALSEYGVVSDLRAYAPGEAPESAYAQTVLDEDIDPVDAVMIVTFREVLSSIRYFGIEPSSSVAVFGCGPVGITFIKFLRLLGVKGIVACDIAPDKLVQAGEFGADFTVNSSDPDYAEQIRAFYPDGLDFVIDAAGVPSITTQAMPLIKDRGAVLCYGVPAQESINIDFSRADYNWRVVFQQMPRKREEGLAHAQVMDWIRSGSLHLRDFISDYFTFEESVEAYGKLLDRKIKKKGIIRF